MCEQASSTDQDEVFLRQTIDIARRAREHGNQPFGAMLVDEAGQIIATAENTIVTEHDATRHAETNVIRAAMQNVPAERLGTATLYASTEPCLMCCGAIHWAGIRRIVFGCAAETLARIIDSNDFLFPSRVIFSKTNAPTVRILGPLLESEAIAVHQGFWT